MARSSSRLYAPYDNGDRGTERDMKPNHVQSHAGGIVVKREGDGFRFLLVRAKKNPAQRIFPKGHVEAGEAPAVHTSTSRSLLANSSVECRFHLVNHSPWSSPKAQAGSWINLRKCVTARLPASRHVERGFTGPPRATCGRQTRARMFESRQPSPGRGWRGRGLRRYAG